VFLANALSPCPVTRVELDSGDNGAVVVVPDRQLSLAIGKEGQNARLCAKLSGLMVNIKSVTDAEEERIQRAADVAQQFKDSPEIAEPSAEEEITLVEAPEAQATTIEPAVELILEPESVLSIEEQLAEATLEIETARAEPDTSKAAAEPPKIPDTVWNAPKVAQQSQRIRFAEDIMAPRVNAPEEGRRKGRTGRGTEEESARSTRRSRRDQYPVDDEDTDHDDGLDDPAP